MRTNKLFALLAALAAFFIACAPALAQWQVPNHSVPVGRGSGITGFKNVAPGTSGYFLGSTGGSTDPTFQGFLQSGTGAATRAWQDKARDVINVKDYGALCNGSNDDTSAIQAAITYAGSLTTGAEVVLPHGQCIVSSTVNISANTQVRGEGQNTTQINVATHDFDIFSVGSGAQSVVIRDILFIGDGNYGATIKYAVSQASTAGDLVIQNVTCKLMFACLKISGSKTRVTELGVSIVKPTDGVGVVIDAGLNEFIRFNNVYMENSDGFDGRAGFDIISGADIECINCNNNHMGTGFLVEPGDGQIVTDLVMLNAGGDNGTGDGMTLVPSGTGVIQRVLINDGWFSSNDGYGIRSNSSVDGLQITSTRIFLNGVDGLNLAAIGGMIVNDNKIGGNAGTGLAFAADTTQFVAKGNVIGDVDGVGPNNIGISVLSGSSDYYDICGNVVTGNTSTQVTDSGSGAHKCTDNGSGTITASTWQASKIGLAYGGTNADLSATGGTKQVLKQSSAGAAITVGQLACSDLSDAASTCSSAGAAWSAFTPSVSSISGTITTVSATGNYQQIGKAVDFSITITLTDNGTGATGIYINDMPCAAQTAGVFQGVDNGFSGKSLVGYIPPTTSRITLTDYAGSYPQTSPTSMYVSGRYECQ